MFSLVICHGFFVLVNQYEDWQLDGQNITALSMILSLSDQNKNILHSCNWTILVIYKKKEELRGNIYSLIKAYLNNQLKSNKQLLFRKGITQYVLQKIFSSLQQAFVTCNNVD